MRAVRLTRMLTGWACVVAGLAVMMAADRSPAAMSDAANKFLGTLSPDQKKAATFPFASAEREHWGFVPSEMFPRGKPTIFGFGAFSLAPNPKQAVSRRAAHPNTPRR